MASLLPSGGIPVPCERVVIVAELVELIYTEERRGLGKEGDPVRMVKQWWTKDGQLVVEKDEWLEREVSKHFPSRTELLRDIEHSTRRLENMQKANDRLERENR